MGRRHRNRSARDKELVPDARNQFSYSMKHGFGIVYRKSRGRMSFHGPRTLEARIKSACLEAENRGLKDDSYLDYVSEKSAVQKREAYVVIRRVHPAAFDRGFIYAKRCDFRPAALHKEKSIGKIDLERKRRERSPGDQRVESIFTENWEGGSTSSAQATSSTGQEERLKIELKVETDTLKALCIRLELSKGDLQRFDRLRDAVDRKKRLVVAAGDFSASEVVASAKAWLEAARLRVELARAGLRLTELFQLARTTTARIALSRISSMPVLADKDEHLLRHYYPLLERLCGPQIKSDEITVIKRYLQLRTPPSDS